MTTNLASPPICRDGSDGNLCSANKIKWLWNLLTGLAYELEMCCNRLSHVGHDFFDGLAGSGAAIEVQNLSAEIRTSIFDNDGVLVHRCLPFKPACFQMLLSVLEAISSPG